MSRVGSPGASTRTAQVVRALLAGASALFGLTIAAVYVGPLSLTLAGRVVSVRTLSRPLLLAVILVIVATVIARPSWRSAAAASGRVVLGALVAFGVMLWMVFLSPTVGGADSYGYVSAADRILSGRLTQEEPLARLMPFARGIEALCPLGYVSAPTGADACVPAYPLGLPALMALATMIGGPVAPFAVAPLAGLVLLAAAWQVARRWYGDTLVALAACALLSVHPLVLTYAIQPMSDLPAAALVLLAVAGLSRTPSLALAAGAAAGAAVLIRPALAPLAVALGAAPLFAPHSVYGSWWHGVAERLRDREAWRTVVRYAMPVGVAGAILAALQWHLYGHPLSSGYGTVGGLFSLAAVSANLRSFGYWTVATLGPALLGAVVVGLAVASRVALVQTLAVTAGLLALYLPYRPFDHWETLRFLLPGLTLVAIIGAAGVVAIARRLVGPVWAAWTSAVVCGAMAWTWLAWMTSQQVFTMPQHEARHRLAGEMVQQVVPGQGVVLALQHSGSLRYYTGRPTLNWERIPPGSLGAAAQALDAAGHPVFLLIDSEQEHARFETIHGPLGDRWLPAGQRRSMQLFEAKRR